MRASLTALLIALTGCTLHEYIPAPLDESRVPTAVLSANLDAPEYGTLLTHLAAATQWPLADWTPTQLGLLAAARSPQVSEARAAVAAAMADRARAAQRENPQFNLALEHHSRDNGGQDSNWSVGPSLDYTLSPISRRHLALAQADVSVVSARAELQEAAWQARTTALTAALELLAQHTKSALAAYELTARATVEAAARAAVAAGITDGFEWQTVLLEVNTARLARLEGLTATAAAQAALAAALNLPPTALARIELKSPPPSVVPPYAVLQTAALTWHPQIRLARAAYAQAEHNLALEIAAQYPEIHLTPGYFFDQGDHVWSLLGGVVVPIFATHEAAISSAQAARDTAREHFYAVQATTLSDLQSAYANWQAASVMLVSAQAIAADVARSHAELVSKQREGIVDRMSVTRAALQESEIKLQVAVSAARIRQCLNALEAAARSPLQDTAFARYLVELDAAVPSP